MEHQTIFIFLYQIPDTIQAFYAVTCFIDKANIFMEFDIIFLLFSFWMRFFVLRICEGKWENSLKVFLRKYRRIPFFIFKIQFL